MNELQCKLTKNSVGLYDLAVMNGAKMVENVKNITFPRAVVMIEDLMYTTGRADDD